MFEITIMKEVAHYVVAIPRTATSGGPTEQFLVVRDDKEQLHLVPGYDLGAWDYAVANRFIQRAASTPSGGITVNGKLIAPDKYIGIWRKAMKEPVAAQWLAQQGYRLVTTIKAPQHLDRGAKPKRTDSPHATFADALQPLGQPWQEDEHYATYRVVLTDQKAVDAAYFASLGFGGYTASDRILETVSLERAGGVIDLPHLSDDEDGLLVQAELAL